MLDICIHRHGMLGTEAIIRGSSQVVNAVLLLYTITHRPYTWTLNISEWSKSVCARYIQGGGIYVLIRRSLDPECTPLKHRYDSCFNLWFEGYLQPALDSRSTEILSSRLQSSSAPSSSSTPSPASSSTPDAVTPESEAELPLRKPLVTSWANAFPKRTRPIIGDTPSEDTTDSSFSNSVPELQRSSYKIDTRGKTRAQIKAEEYEKACGEPWRLYQSCLKVCFYLGAKLMNRKRLHKTQVCRLYWNRRGMNIRWRVRKDCLGQRGIRSSGKSHSYIVDARSIHHML